MDSTTTVTMRDLRNHGAEVVERAQRGDDVIVTRDGEPVVVVRALPRSGLSARELIARRRHLPALDPVGLRADVDEAVDMSL